jgi:hypothetical protein
MSDLTDLRSDKLSPVGCYAVGNLIQMDKYVDRSADFSILRHTLIPSHRKYESCQPIYLIGAVSFSQSSCLHFTMSRLTLSDDLFPPRSRFLQSSVDSSLSQVETPRAEGTRVTRRAISDDESPSACGWQILKRRERLE